MQTLFLPQEPELLRRLWTIHRIETYDLENKLIGYIKIGCIHPKVARRFTVWDYLSELKGWCLGKTLVDRWIQAHLYARQDPASSGINYLQLSKKNAPDELTMEADLKILEKQYKKERRSYLRRRSNFAYVDYIDVGFSYRRQGIGTNLYRIAAQYLGQYYGLALHSSTLQSEEARGAWKKMFDSKDYPITQIIPKKVNKRRYYRFDRSELFQKGKVCEVGVPLEFRQ